MINEIQPVIDVRLRLGIGLVVILAGLIIITVFYYFENIRDELKFAGAVVVSMAAIFSAYYVAETMRLKLILDKQNDEKDKIKKSLSFSFTDDTNLSVIITRLDKHLKIHSRNHQEIPLEEIRQFPNDEYPEFNLDIAFILCRFEVMCIAIKNEIACEDTCIDLSLSRMVLYYDLFKQHIKDRQNTIGKDIYENFVGTAIRWQGIRNDLYRKDNA